MRGEFCHCAGAVCAPAETPYKALLQSIKSAALEREPHIYRKRSVLTWSDPFVMITMQYAPAGRDIDTECLELSSVFYEGDL